LHFICQKADNKQKYKRCTQKLWNTARMHINCLEWFSDSFFLRFAAPARDHSQSSNTPHVFLLGQQRWTSGRRTCLRTKAYNDRQCNPYHPSWTTHVVLPRPALPPPPALTRETGSCSRRSALAVRHLAAGHPDTRTIRGIPARWAEVRTAARLLVLPYDPWSRMLWHFMWVHKFVHGRTSCHVAGDCQLICDVDRPWHFYNNTLDVVMFCGGSFWVSK